MKIGIPKALMFYEYEILWKNFFENLGYSTVISTDTNKEILENGIKYSIDETCLASKVFMGHVYYLLGKCDYIFIPRFCSFVDSDVACCKFNALYDICKNVYKDIPILTYDVDVRNKKSEMNGFINVGKMLGFNKLKSINAYMNAKRSYLDDKISAHKEQVSLRKQDILSEEKDESKINLLIVSHPYIYKDKFMGSGVLNYLNNNKVNLLYADIYDRKNSISGWKKYTNSIYWKFSKDLLNGINENIDYADGVIFLTVFPCGLDSLVNEMCRNNLKDKPVLNLVIDELESDTGILTRLESFLDIIKIKKMQ